MPVFRLIRWFTLLFVAAGIVLVDVSCFTPSTPEADTTAPAAPDRTLLRATAPENGSSTVSGEPGAVEANASVTVRESGVPDPASVTVSAGASGAFSVSLATELLVSLEVVAVDAAGNAGEATLLAVGAPFSLQVEGTSQATLTAGEVPASPLAVVLRDESGQATSGVDVSFTLPGSEDLTATTDTAGRAEWQDEAPTLAGSSNLVARVAAELISQDAVFDLEITAAAAAQIDIASGSEQIADAGEVLKDPLVARVTDSYGNPVSAVQVDWTTASGTLSAASSSTDAAGQAQVDWTLPGLEGEYTTAAQVNGILSGVSFVGVAGGAPVVDSYTPDPALAGGQITIAGQRFSRAPVYNEVFFPTAAGVTPGEVVSATQTQLVVQLPNEASSGDLQVRVCERDAPIKAFVVETAMGNPVDLEPGGASVRLDTPTGNEVYMLAVYNPTASSASYSFDGSTPASKARPATVLSAADTFHAWLRQQEHYTRHRPKARVSPTPMKPVAQNFTVLASLSNETYEQVTADLKYAGSQVLIYVDQRVTDTEITDADVTAMGQKFESNGYATVRDKFGSESDVDQDAKVTVLLTPTVNELTPPGSGAFVGGFFFSQDLHAGANSNEMEILYGIVPDPTGRWGNSFSKSFILGVLDGVLPHEFQHLVSYNEHVLVHGGSPEELWLNEALSHLAEDMVGETEQNEARAGIFLDDPPAVSLTLGGNALEERGMSFLFVRYLADREDASFVSRLVQTDRVGIENVEVASSRDFADWMRDWAVTLVVDSHDLGAVPYRYDSIALQADYGPPQAAVTNLASPSGSDVLVGTSMAFYRLQGTGNSATDLQLSGQAQGVVLRIE